MSELDEGANTRFGLRSIDVSVRPSVDRTAFDMAGTDEEAAAGRPRSTDDDVIDHLETEVGRILRGAQSFAHAVMERARKRERVIIKQAEGRSRAVMTQADAEATAILQRAAAEAVKRVKEAEREVASMVAAAAAHRSEILSDLEEESERLSQKIALQRAEHERLTTVFSVVEDALREARGALCDATESPVGRAASSEGVSDSEREQRSPATQSARDRRRDGRNGQRPTTGRL